MNCVILYSNPFKGFHSAAGRVSVIPMGKSCCG